MSTRGEHLVRADRRFATGGGIVAQLVAPAFSKVLDEIDRRLAHGGIEAILPGGERRHLGFHASGPVADVVLTSWLALVRLATSGSVGWYKAWALGEWSSSDPVRVFEIFSANAVALGDVGRAKGPFRWLNALAHRLRDNGPTKARENIAAHYDLGNDFYSAWLDTTMTYSSALFGSAGESLEQAQLRKVATLLDRLELRPGQRVLEIGCGWGTLAIEAAKRGASVVGLTLSTEQKAWAEQKIAQEGLGDRIEIRLQDYRDITEQFDAVASVEMVEAVGKRWWATYLDSIARNLVSSGRAALQFIAIDGRIFENYAQNADFIQTYIFPGGMLLDEARFELLARERGLSWTDRCAFGADYTEILKRCVSATSAPSPAALLAGSTNASTTFGGTISCIAKAEFRGGAIDVAQVTLVKS